MKVADPPKELPPPPPEPKHDPKTMSYRREQTTPIKTDRGDFAFRKNGPGDR